MKLTGLITSEEFDVRETDPMHGVRRWERAGTKRIEIRMEQNGFFAIRLPHDHPFKAGDEVEITLSKKGDK
jgi:hypothetical protein